MAALPITLATDGCQVYRPAASFSTAAASSSKAPYVTHLAASGGSSGGGGGPLVCFTDDGVLRTLDRHRLALTSTPRAWEAGGMCTSLCTVAGGPAWFAAGRNGVISYFEAAGGGGGPQERICLRGPSGAPYLSVAASSDGHSVAAGTELHGVDATVDIWDTRNPSKPKLTYTESHSDDVTWLSYHGTVSHALLSASSDGLVSILDTQQTDEDDAVLGVTNTGASVARAGWGFGHSPYAYAKPDPPHLRNKDGSPYADARAGAHQSADTDADADADATTKLGCFWSASDMQTFGVWEADDFDELVPPVDVRAVKPTSVRNRWKSDYIIDAWSTAGTGLMLHCGDQRGNVAVIGVPHGGAGGGSPLQWQMHGLLAAAPSGASGHTRNSTFGSQLHNGHTDIVRAICSSDNETFYTGGEDGLVCAWKTSEEQHRIAPDSFDFEGFQQGAGGLEDGDDNDDEVFGRPRHAGSAGGKVRSEERQKPSFRPY